MKQLRLELDVDELSEFAPQVQEALWRLARRGQPEQDLRTASERFRASIVRGPTERELAAKVNEFQHPDGITIRETPSLKPRREIP